MVPPPHCARTLSVVLFLAAIVSPRHVCAKDLYVGIGQEGEAKRRGVESDNERKRGFFISVFIISSSYGKRIVLSGVDCCVRIVVSRSRGSEPPDDVAASRVLGYLL